MSLVPDSRDLLARLNFAFQLFPGAGYFGDHPTNQLTIEINHDIDALEIAVEAPWPELINIAAISFYGADGTELPRASICAGITLSSVHKSMPDGQAAAVFLAGHLLHTDPEPRPHLRIALQAPVMISRITICNRGDIWGKRSLFLVAQASLGGRVVRRHQNISAGKVLWLLEDLLQELGVAALPDFANHQAVEACLADLRARVCAAIDRGALGWSPAKLMWMLPLYERLTTATPAPWQTALMARLALMGWAGTEDLETASLGCFQQLLATGDSLEALRLALQDLVNRRDGTQDRITISRHVINRSRLLKRKEEYLSEMERLIATLKSEGVVAMMSYGTLLGAVRDGGFIPHDDDVDLVYFDGATSAEASAAGKSRICDIVQAAGYRVIDTGYGHMSAVHNDILLDLFPAWTDGAQMYLAMEQLKIRGVPLADMLPPGQVTLYGHAVDSPANPEAFLEQRYGAGWRIPDPWYDWLWPLNPAPQGLAPGQSMA